MNNRKQNRHISTKISYIKKIDIVLLVAIFFMFLALIVALDMGTSEYKNEQRKFIGEALEILADNQRVPFENYTSNKVQILQGLTSFPEIYRMDSSEQYEFLQGHSQSLGFHHIFVMYDTGKGWYIDEKLWRNQKNEQFFSDIMENDIYITEPYYGGGITITTICVSIYDESGKKVGALCGAVELTEVKEIFSKNKTMDHGENYLVGRRGQYISASDIPDVYKVKPIYEEENSDYAIVKEAFEDKCDKTGTIIKDGEEYQAYILYLKDYDWVIIQCINASEAYQSFQSINIWRYTMLFIVLVIVFCVSRIAFYWTKGQSKIATDTLTGCNSRAAMESLVDKLELQHNYQVSIIYMDLNKFKYVNDTFGHDVGDEILCIFSRVLTEVFKNVGQVGRMGGDEFMIILLDVEKEEIDKLCAQVEKRLVEESKKLKFDYTIRTSYGYASREIGSEESLTTIITRADEKMYIHKEQNR